MNRRSLRYRCLSRVVIGAEDECWPWPGHVDNKGYGFISGGMVAGKQKRLKVHRVVYELLVGLIPDGLTIDHTCHNADETCAGGPTCVHRRCVNPAHLEAVTATENTRRGHSISALHGRRDTCLYGHPHTPENTRITPQGWRDCRTCGRQRARLNRERRLQRQAAA